MKVIMSIEKPLRLGVLGLGEGRSVISAALSAPEWEIGMLCDLSESLCRERCREFGQGVMVGQSTRFVESMMRQRADFEAGRFGDLVSVEAQYIHDHRKYMSHGWGPELRKTMNWVYLGLSHPVDLVRWYLPDIEEVFA